MLNLAADPNLVNSDDIIMAFLHFSTQVMKSEVKRDFLRQSYKNLGLCPDRSLEPQPEKLLRYQLMQRCMSIQAAFGYKANKDNQLIESKLAWVFLTLRSIGLTFAFGFQKDPKSTTSTDVDMIDPGEHPRTQPLRC